MSYSRIEDTKVYQRACALANEVYFAVRSWNRFDQDSSGLQLLRAMDSIGANLVEGDSKLTDPDTLRFFGYAVGSCREAEHWIRQVQVRGCISGVEGAKWVDESGQIGRMLAALIAFRRSRKSKNVRESSWEYEAAAEPIDWC